MQSSDSERSSREFWISTVRVAAIALAILSVTGCLLLTKSRSAYVALGACALLLPFCGASWRRFDRRLALAGIFTVVLLVVAAILGGGLDAQVLTEASKSLGFRLQYWQATLSMIARHPWLGVGPGNFQDYYTQFKLPQASEEIRDPHNFLLEVWATCGTFAFVALVAALAMLAWRLWHARAESSSSPTIRRPTAAGTTNEVLYVVVGGGAGFLLAFLIGPLFGYSLTELQILGGLLLGGAVVAALWAWIVAGELPAGRWLWECWPLASIYWRPAESRFRAWPGRFGFSWPWPSMSRTANRLTTCVRDSRRHGYFCCRGLSACARPPLLATTPRCGPSCDSTPPWPRRRGSRIHRLAWWPTWKRRLPTRFRRMPGSRSPSSKRTNCGKGARCRAVIRTLSMPRKMCSNCVRTRVRPGGRLGPGTPRSFARSEQTGGRSRRGPTASSRGALPDVGRDTRRPGPGAGHGWKTGQCRSAGRAGAGAGRANAARRSEIAERNARFTRSLAERTALTVSTAGS